MLDFVKIYNIENETKEEGVVLGELVDHDEKRVIDFMATWCFRIDNIIEYDKKVNGEYTKVSEECLHNRGFTLSEYYDLFNSHIQEDEFLFYPVYQQMNISSFKDRDRVLLTYKLQADTDSYLTALSVAGVTKKLSFFFNKRLPYYVKFQDRQAHIAMTAPPGSGKSVLLMHDVYRTIREYKDTCSFVVLDPHGSFARKVYKLKLNSDPSKVTFFAPKFFGEENLPSFNVFDLKELSLFEVNNIMDTIVNAIAEVQEEVETKGNIEKVLQKCVQFLLRRNNPSTLLTLQDLLNLKKTIRDEAKKFDSYFGSEFEGTDRSSRHAVLRRIGKIIPDKLSELLLTRPSTINLQKCMDTPGMVTIFDLSAVGPITRQALGKFIMANIRGNALQRDEDKHTQCFVWVDEAPEVSAGSLQVILDQCRKYGVGLFLASQYLHQYGNQAKSVELSTAIKICSGQYVKDVSGLIVVPDKYLRKKQRGGNEYIENSRLDLDRYEYFVKAPYTDLGKFKSASFLLKGNKYYMTPEEQEKVDEHQKERYYTDITNMSANTPQSGYIEDVETVLEEEFHDKNGARYFRNAPVDLP